MDIKKAALALHKENRGKFAIVSKVPVSSREDLSLAYSPGVAEPCLVIANEPEKVFEYTAKGNLVAVVSNGTAVLGLGDIGPLAAMPVMEGKAILFKKFAGIDAIPICLDTKDPDAIIETVKLMAPTFGGINLEDIAAPQCFYIEEKLKSLLDIPVFHDDQHGTAVVALAGLINSMAIVNKNLFDLNVVINGAGAAGTAIARLLVRIGVKNVAVLDRQGAIYQGREKLNEAKTDLAKILPVRTGSLAEELKGADVFIGVSSADILTAEMVKSMNKNAIIFALANPNPEIKPELALESGAAIVATGRSDYPNQINNVLGFPGIFRGALAVRARGISEGMKEAAAKAIALCVKNPTSQMIIPGPFDPDVPAIVARAVAEAAIREGLARTNVDLDRLREEVRSDFQAKTKEV